MAPTAKATLVKSLAKQRAQDYMWGIPESPEFSFVQRLVNEFKTHESDEARWLSRYKMVAAESEDPVSRFLLHLIIADEERHHEIIGRMISTMKDDLASAGIGPSRTVKGRKKARELAAAIDRFVDVERKGIKEYRRLIKASRGVHQQLFGLLCRTMVQDSLKHIGILDFLRSKLREGQRVRIKTKT